MVILHYLGNGSLMGEKNGRILQAHDAWAGLVIRKSNLLIFSPWKSRKERRPLRAIHGEYPYG